MKVSIIIGFQYVNNVYWETLPGIIIDIYGAYRLAKNMDSDRIVIITDINKDFEAGYFFDTFGKDIVDADIFRFIDDINKQKIFYKYSNRDNFYDTIITHILGADCIFFYYSGHLHDMSIILPDDMSGNIYQRMETHIIKRIITKKSDSNSESVIILDCCNGNSINLPYIYDGSKFRLSNIRYLCQNRILTISLTDDGDVSLATKYGSYFSRYILWKLQYGICSIGELYNGARTQLYQSVIIRSSYPDVLLIPGWLFRSGSYKISLDIKTSSIRIKQ